MAPPFPRLASAPTECRGPIHCNDPGRLNAGFHHFDTEQIYRNEADVGECVAASGLRRGDVFLTTKVWVENYPDLAFADSACASLVRTTSTFWCCT
jgi:2,5-diketo-D-gluconate reductase B